MHASSANKLVVVSETRNSLSVSSLLDTNLSHNPFFFSDSFAGTTVSPSNWCPISSILAIVLLWLSFVGRVVLSKRYRIVSQTVSAVVTACYQHVAATVAAIYQEWERREQER